MSDDNLTSGVVDPVYADPDQPDIGDVEDDLDGEEVPEAVDDEGLDDLLADVDPGAEDEPVIEEGED